MLLRMFMVIGLWAVSVTDAAVTEPTTFLLPVCEVLTARETPRTTQPETILAPVPQAYWLKTRALVTAYTNSDELDAAYHATKGEWRWRTATGVDTRYQVHGIAADPRALPYGTRVVVPGFLPVSQPNTSWPVDDTGGAMRQSWARGILHIDVRYRTPYSAKNWGRRYQDIWVWVMPGTELEARLQTYATDLSI